MAVLVDTNPDVNAVPADAGASQGTSVNNYTLSSYAQDIPPIISLVIVAESVAEAVWGVPLSNDQGAISLMNNAINATNSGTQTMVNMLSALVGYMWQVQPV